MKKKHMPRLLSIILTVQVIQTIILIVLFRWMAKKHKVLESKVRA